MSYAQDVPTAMTADEATYACTTCGTICVFCVMFGLLSNEFPDEFNKTDERGVWIILLLLVVLGSVWSVFVVEPVVGIMQEDQKEIPSTEPGGEPIFVPVYFCSGDARKMCVVFGALALTASVFGVLTNEFNAIKQTERPFWWMLLAMWGLTFLFIMRPIFDRLCDTVAESARETRRGPRNA
jgi:hypothetical protein